MAETIDIQIKRELENRLPKGIEVTPEDIYNTKLLMKDGLTLMESCDDVAQGIKDAIS
jgi:hypothetical protein